MLGSLVRYPGGKFPVASRIAKHFDCSKPLLEPFAGGASVGLQYLRSGGRKLYLVDLNESIVNLWRQVKSAPKDVESYLPDHPTVEGYFEAKENLDEGPLGAANKIIVLRCSMGAYGNGPIGGQDQTGKYKIDARWNLKKIKESLLENSDLLWSASAEISYGDGIAAIQRHPKFQVYADPPYIKAGKGLYGGEFDHKGLVDALFQHPSFWVVTIDETSSYYATIAGNSEPLSVSGNRGSSNTLRRQNSSEFILTSSPQPGILT